MLERINDNAYKLELLGEYGVSISFNVFDSSPFDVGDDLRTISFQEEENDAMCMGQRRGLGGYGLRETQPTCGTQRQDSKDPLSLPSSPVTRLKAKRFKEALNRLIQEEVGEIADSWRPNILNKLEGNLV